MALLTNKQNAYPIVFIVLGVIILLTTFFLTEDTVLSLVSSLFGVVCVVLCAQGNIIHFFFGFIQIGTHLWICYTERLYSSMFIDVFYLVTQIIGLFLWYKHLRKGESESESSVLIVTQKMAPKVLALLAVSVLVLSFAVGAFLRYFTDDSQPYLDSFCNVPAFVAQILMIKMYREQYYFWLFLDVCFVILWLIAGNYCMMVQYIFWTINCFYGYFQWTKLSAE